MTSSSVPLTGSIVALVTPMHEDGSVDYPQLRKLIDWHIAEGTDCIGVVGTTGESPTVSVDEHCEIIRVAVQHAAGRVPIMAGAGANSTREAIELTRFSQEVGADCTLQVVPYYNKPSQEGIYQHFKAIAEAVDLPVVLYNVPGRTGSDLLPETVAELYQHPRIIGIKEARSEPERMDALLAFKGESFSVLSGDDPTACRAMLAGADGVISVASNVLPRSFRRLCDLARGGHAADRCQSHDGLGASQAAREMGVAPLQQSHFRQERVGFGGLGASFGRCQRSGGSCVALPAPIAKG